MKKTHHTPEYLAKIEARLARLADAGILERAGQREEDGELRQMYRLARHVADMPRAEAVELMAAVGGDFVLVDDEAAS